MNHTQIQESKAIWYKGELSTFPVIKIPLDSLLYNQYNGRIKSAVLSYESSTGRKLNPKDSNDRKIIENYLFESAENRNEKTLQSLKDYGQQEIGIVTQDLIVIDGNRRASLLNKIYREDRTVDYFKAIILPDKLEDNPLEIIKLETNYQMGVDNKVEYKPIEKYLRCQELIISYNISVDEVAKLMAEKPARINQWLSILSLMKEYLIYLDSPDVFTRLDKKEGHFVDLYNYLKQTNYNIELKEAYFDFIRLGLPVQRSRIIGNPKENQSIFSHNSIWKSFYNKHQEIKLSLNEKKFNEVKAENPDMSNEQVFRNIDDYFKENLGQDLMANLLKNEILIKELKIKDNIKNELRKIKNYITTISSVDIINSDRELIRELLLSISTDSQIKASLV